MSTTLQPTEQQIILQAALAQTRRLPGHEQQYDERVLQAAHELFKGRLGLGRLYAECAQANGYHWKPGQSVNTEVQAIACGRGSATVQAAYSTVSLPGILESLANAELLAGYEHDDPQYQMWRQIAQVKSVNDFKEVSYYRLLDDSTYERVSPGGKIKHGSLSEEKLTHSVQTYAKMLSLTRTDVINDDLDAFDSLRKRLGVGAAMKLSNLFWETFLNNAAFFTGQRGNYTDGTLTNLGTDGLGLQLGLTAFESLRSPTADGSKRLNGKPTIIMVPPELGPNAEKLYKNENTGGGTTVQEANIHAGKYTPIEVPWLSDPAFPNWSATAWYLLRDPKLMAAVVVSFMNGIEQPVVESSEANFDTLGFDFRGYHDFGVDQSEPFAGVKVKGQA